ncbi:cytochrome c biogenesis protein ResB [Paenibacillus chitinolyticus]|uniref:cytochrome c biogenesis protein ResB n=1 Tax=Paenibacillus chitinolyticus TaxID=79263 RepID=UPI002DC014F5|nr:cytochrome c biogenesis protein ResB [Paenibacillus chitinolyticus]MEC0245705.1 cytochrome c biogenesis protein ResB [Paenibacillus chitinolyticus]
MFQNTKCDCGHQNHVGTLLCESCGKPLTEEAFSDEPLEMKYDGVARRSQRENPSWLDRVWNFFSSVKVAVTIIVLTLIGSSLGTIYPQESNFIQVDPATYYKDTYGTLGHVYYLLGLSHTYESWWFKLLILMIGASLVICSLDRVLPLYRALSKQKIQKHHSFLLRQKVSYDGRVPEGIGEEEWTEQMARQLRKKHYRVHTDGAALLAEKYRFSRWGPYVLHIGLIIFLLAVLMRSFPGWQMDEYMGLREGEIKKIPDTSLYIKNEKFTIDFYKPEEMTEEFKKRERAVPKIYETEAVIYTCKADCDTPGKKPELQEVHRQKIIVNEPLDYKGLLAFQYDYKEAPLLISVKPTLTNKQTGESYGSFDLPMKDPQDTYQAGPYKLSLKGYFPEFGLDDKGEPITKSNEAKAPAFIFQITGPGLSPNGEPYIYFPRQIDKQEFRQDEINGSIGAKFDLSVGSMENVTFSSYTSYLNIRTDRALPYIWIGAAIGMIGLIMGFYWQHRRVWLRIDDGRLVLGAHTNKNWFGVRKEVAAALDKTGITVDQKTLEKGGKAT